MSVEASEVGAEPSLAEILKGDAPASDPSPKAEPTAAKAAEPVKSEVAPVTEPAKAAPERGADGKFVAKVAEPAAQPEKAAEPVKAERPDWVNGIIAERRKRQAAQASAAQPEQPKPKTEFYDNADRAFEERMSGERQQWSERFFRLSVKAAKAGKDDYDAVLESFGTAAQRDPRLIDALHADDDPGEFMYIVGKQIRELEDVQGDIGRYRDKVTAEMKGQLAERDAKIKDLDSKLAALQKQYDDLSTVGRSLSTTTSSRTAADVLGDEDDLKSIVRFGNKQR